MSVVEWEQFNEIFDMPMSNIFSSRSSKFFLEVTLNYPRDTRFKRLIYNSQKKLYENLITYLKTHHTFIKHIDHYYENCKDGLPHVHAMFCCEADNVYSPEGAVMDIVRTYISQLPKRSQLTLYKYQYNHILQMFKCPSICINYKQVNAEAWNSYIIKSQ